jgi:hypothetical protein
VRRLMSGVWVAGRPPTAMLSGVIVGERRRPEGRMRRKRVKWKRTSGYLAATGDGRPFLADGIGVEFEVRPKWGGVECT